MAYHERDRIADLDLAGVDRGIGWTVELDRAKRRLGLTSYNRRVVSLSGSRGVVVGSDINGSTNWFGSHRWRPTWGRDLGPYLSYWGSRSKLGGRPRLLRGRPDFVGGQHRLGVAVRHAGQVVVGSRPYVWLVTP